MALFTTFRLALTPNRVAAIVSVIGSLGALCAALAGVLPGGAAANAAVAAAALLAKAGTVITFLRGSQKWDALSMPTGTGRHATERPPGA